MTIRVDESVAPELAAFFGGRGHILVFGEAGTGDPDIVADANVHAAVVLTSDRDFLRLVTRNPARDNGRYPRAGLIVVSGEDVIALARVTQHIDLIEFLFARLQRETDPRLIMHIRERTVWIDL